MTTKQLLSSNSYIQYPRFLGNYIGVNEAVLLSALCDKDNWCEFNIQNYDGWFYYLRDEIELETGLSESQQRTALKSLSDLSIIHTKRAGIPSKVYYKLNIDVLENVLNEAQNAYKAHKSQWSQNMTTCDTKTMTTCDIENRISTIDNNIYIKTNNKSTVAGALSKKHPRNFSKEKLTDDLESGKDIDLEKKSQKQSPKDKFREECYDIIDDVYSENNFSYMVLDLLKEYFEFVSAVPDNKDNLCKRVKTVKAWKHKLDTLVQLAKDGYNPADIIQQSLDRKQYVFYPLQSEYKKTTSRHECFTESIHSTPIEEARAAMEEKKQRGVKTY